MNRRLVHALAVLLAFALLQSPAPAQVKTPPTLKPQEPSAPRRVEEPDDPDDDVVRITSNLVQFDAVVTDKKGRQVTDLNADDFEVTVDGKPQPLTNFSYIWSVGDPHPAAPTPTPAPTAAAPPAPPVRLRPEQVRRTVAFVFNDLQMSWESVYYARRAIKKFVDEQMEPGDLVAIIPTSGGSGALQQFTSDKRLLGAAVKNLRWYPQLGGSGVTVFDRLAEADARTEAERQFEVRRRERFSVGTLNALDAVVGALRDLPGRKSLVLLSDGIPIPPPEEDHGRVLDGVNQVIESANRASVIIYAVDSRGLQNLAMFDASQSGVPDPQTLMALSTARSAEMQDSQRTMRALAEETGGVAYVNSNDIGGGVRRAIEDQRGYYLIGFRPEDGTFDPLTRPLRFHKVSVRVRREGLKVRTRAGFFGFEGKSLSPLPPPRTRAQQIHAALVAPFPAGGVRLRLTPILGRDTKKGAFIRSLLHVEGGDVTFRQQPDGTYKVVLDVVALTFGVNGRPMSEANMTHNVIVKPEDYEMTRRGGLVYNMVVPAKKSGGYQLRVAVRDTATERVGSASQFVEVPDLKKDRLALSGLVMSARGITAQPSPPAPVAPDPLGGAAVRRFRRGTEVDYGFRIYNAKFESGGGARLQTQVRLFREGRAVFTGQVLPFEGRPENSAGDISAGGRLRLGGELGPGEYVLQLVVTDLLAPEKYRVATQWIDFEVVE